jgi:hypothetical protein
MSWGLGRSSIQKTGGSKSGHFSLSFSSSIPVSQPEAAGHSFCLLLLFPLLVSLHEHTHGLEFWGKS